MFLTVGKIESRYFVGIIGARSCLSKRKSRTFVCFQAHCFFEKTFGPLILNVNVVSCPF